MSSRSLCAGRSPSSSPFFDHLFNLVQVLSARLPIMREMPHMKTGHRKVPPFVAAVVRPVSTRLSRMEALLIEMRAEQDVKLKKIKRLQEQVDELADTVKRRLI